MSEPLQPSQPGATPTRVAGTTTLSLPDEAGQVRRLTLHPVGHYTVDSLSTPRSALVGTHDATELWVPTPHDLLGKVRFPHVGSWDAAYLGYENLWMLISHYPREVTPAGEHCRLDGLAAQRTWLTLNRALPGHLITTVTFVGPDPATCSALLTAWMRDRIAEEWDGEAHSDHGLAQTPLWVSAGDEQLVSLTFTAGSTEAGGPTAAWVVRRAVPLRGMAPIAHQRTFAAPSEVAEAVASFVAALAQPGRHWRAPDTP